MQYQSPRYAGDIGKAYTQLVACRREVRESLSPETLREAYVHFFGDLQRRTEVSLVRACEVECYFLHGEEVFEAKTADMAHNVCDCAVTPPQQQ